MSQHEPAQRPVLLLRFPEGETNDQDLARIAALAPAHEIHHTNDDGRLEALLDRVEVLAGSSPPRLLQRMPRLRWYQQWGAGADWLLKHPEMRDLPFTLTNTAGMHAIQITEHVFALLLAQARLLPGALQAQGRREWLHEPQSSLCELDGKTMVIVGLGAIGARLAVVAAAFGMRVLGISRSGRPGAAAVSRMGKMADLAAFLAEADVIVAAAPYTEETHHLFNSRTLASVKPGAWFVNIGRGGLVDESALVQALKEGRLAAAGLDVFETEPLPSNSPLWDLPNVIITGHYAGLTPVYHKRALEIFIDNLERYVAGQPLTHVVDKGLGY